MRRRSVRLAALAATAVGLLGATGAQAATITPTQPCYRYAPNLAGQNWVGVTGSGFTPGTNPSLNGVRFDYPGEVAGFTPLAADGSFGTNLPMPLDFIQRRSGLIKRYTLTATDQTNPAITAATELTFVRVGLLTKPSRVGSNLHRRVRWAAYGAPTGARLYVHWTFKGRRLATRGLGRAKGSCGVARKQIPFLPVAARGGTWKVYVTKGRRLKRDAALFRVNLKIL